MAQPSVGCQVECDHSRGPGFGVRGSGPLNRRVRCWHSCCVFRSRRLHILEVQCLKKPRSNAPAKPSGLVNRQRLKLVNSFAKRYTTFGKASMVLDQRSKRLRSDSQKPAEPASSFRRHRPAPHGVRSKARHRRAEPDGAVALGRRRPNGRGRPSAHSNAKAAAPRRGRRSRSRLAPLLAVGNDEDVRRRRRTLQLA